MRTATTGHVGRRVAPVLLTGVLALAGAGCGTKTVHRSINAALVNGAAGFTPANITVDKGDKVDLKVGNTTTAAHGFTIEGYPSVKPQVEQPNQPILVKFTASKAGTFTIRCQLHPRHRPATLVVR